MLFPRSQLQSFQSSEWFPISLRNKSKLLMWLSTVTQDQLALPICSSIAPPASSSPGGREVSMVRPGFSSVQFGSVAQSCPTPRDPINRSTPDLPAHHQLPESTQTRVHWVGDAIQPSHPLWSPSPALNVSQHQGLFKWVSSSHHVAKDTA